MWRSVSSTENIPKDRDLRLAVIDGDGVHELVFLSRRLGMYWIDAKTRRTLEVRPTHWQEWPQEKNR